MCKPHLDSRLEPSLPPTTDYEYWAVPTWECFGNNDGITCETRWKCPELPGPLYTADGQKRLIEMGWPGVLLLSTILSTVNIAGAPWPPFWCILLGVAMSLLINRYVGYKFVALLFLSSASCR